MVITMVIHELSWVSYNFTVLGGARVMGRSDEGWRWKGEESEASGRDWEVGRVGMQILQGFPPEH